MYCIYVCFPNGFVRSVQMYPSEYTRNVIQLQAVSMGLTRVYGAVSRAMIALFVDYYFFFISYFQQPCGAIQYQPLAIKNDSRSDLIFSTSHNLFVPKTTYSSVRLGGFRQRMGTNKKTMFAFCPSFSSFNALG